MNNDDLVEIIGNVSEPGKIIVHLGKMFAAITSLDIKASGNGVGGVEESNASLTVAGENAMGGNTQQMAYGMCSKEGERVDLVTPIPLSIGVKEWLSQLESGMAVTLATLLQQASSSASSLTTIANNTAEDGSVVVDSEKENKFLLTWIDKFPAQIVILSSQVAWTFNIEEALKSSAGGVNSSGGNSTLSTVLSILESKLKLLSASVLH